MQNMNEIQTTLPFNQGSSQDITLLAQKIPLHAIRKNMALETLPQQFEPPKRGFLVFWQASFVCVSVWGNIF